MDDNGFFNENININSKKDDFKNNNFDDLLVKEEEENKINENDEYEINKEEIEINSPELLQDSKCPKKENTNKEEKKENKIDNINQNHIKKKRKKII